MVIIFPKRHKISSDYEITAKKLGRGLDGYILEIIHKKTKEKYALKMLRACEKSRKEIRYQYLMSLDCEHIVKIIDIYENEIENILYYLVVMEYMQGGNLKERMSHVKFAEKDIVEIIMQLGKAIEHLHFSGIVHCGIRPENILFLNNTDNIVKITDFREAKESNVIRIDPQIGKRSFTPLYFSPEILNAKKLKNYYSFPSDIWSLGIVLFILCHEKAPFDVSANNPNSKEIREKIRNGDYKIENNGFSYDLYALLKKLLTTSPEVRIKIGDVLKYKIFKNNKFLLEQAINET